MNDQVGVRGRRWFQALTGDDTSQSGDPGSVLASKASLGSREALFLCVVPNPESRFPCVRDGQVGLEEAYALASHIRALIAEDEDKPKEEKRPIVAIVDVKSQAYGRREETVGIFLAAATAADAYATARMKGHPVVSLIAGHAFSGGFLTHGYQANRLVAFDDKGIVIHAMHEEAAARITRRSVADLLRLGHEIPPMSYDVHDYARLGLLHELLHMESPEEPVASEVAKVRQSLANAIADCANGERDLSNRWKNPQANVMRKAGNAVRELMEQEWQRA